MDRLGILFQSTSLLKHKAATHLIENFILETGKQISYDNTQHNHDATRPHSS